MKLLLLWLLLANPTQPAPKAAKTKSLTTAELAEFSKAAPEVQKLISAALELTAKDLTYLSASADPAKGGMDCSGCIYYLLQSGGVKSAPRQSNEMYAWTWQAKTFRATNSLSMKTFEWEELQPGDLVFWVNSTSDGKSDRDPPVTHVMLYIGRRAKDQQPLLVGSSDGRTYDGQSMCGVSVFDFKLPSPGSPSRVIGYARVPGLPISPPASKTAP
jgi:hypothetical protein